MNPKDLKFIDYLTKNTNGYGYRSRSILDIFLFDRKTFHYLKDHDKIRGDAVRFLYRHEAELNKTRVPRKEKARRTKQILILKKIISYEKTPTQLIKGRSISEIRASITSEPELDIPAEALITILSFHDYSGMSDMELTDDILPDYLLYSGNGTSIVDLFLDSPEVFNEYKKKRVIAYKAVHVCKANRDKLVATQQIEQKQVRVYMQNKIISDYLEKNSMDGYSWNMFDDVAKHIDGNKQNVRHYKPITDHQKKIVPPSTKPQSETNEKPKSIVCPYDHRELKVIKNYGKSESDYVFYTCTSCGRIFKHNLVNGMLLMVEGEKKKPEMKQKQPVVEEHIIEYRDFMIRSYAFKCIHEKHHIHDIRATVSIVDGYGDEKEMTIPAGYCRECDVYFILEGEYQKLKKSGMILCRITDMKTYRKDMLSSNGMNLASQSLLMQYGYNVSQTKGLTEAQRHTILDVIIGHGILSKQEVISYLTFFISQRENRKNDMYREAIRKWKTDIDYVRTADFGSSKKFRVKSLTRR